MMKSWMGNVSSLKNFFLNSQKAGKSGPSQFLDLFTAFALAAGLLVTGLVLVRDYAPGWDESPLQVYAQQSFAAYGNLVRTGNLPVFGSSDLKYYGPAYLMVCELIARVLNFVRIGWPVTQWHIAIFLSFILSVVSIYFLAHKWLRWWSSLGVTLLFATQPLLLGHAFINPKDIPFMAFFLATVTVGIEVVDRHVSTGELARLSFFKGVLRAFFHPLVLLAAFLLGFTTSIRILGPYAGLIVVLYGLVKSWKNMLKTLPAFFLVAAVVSFLTWPFLWRAPLLNIIQTIKIMSDFPWDGVVLFRGIVQRPVELPRYFYPFLMSIQLTEPVVILSVIGFFISIYLALIAKKFEILFLIITWFLIPLLAVIYLTHTWYDNFRQLLFLMPPVFLSAGLVLDQVFEYIKPTLARILILVVLIAPGIYSVMKLHPYEYVYFNSFTGGVNGAYRNYELDYWDVSYRDAALYLNQIAPKGANVIVFGPERIFAGFSRPDLKVVFEPDIKNDIIYDYAVITTRANADEYKCASAEVIHTINVDKAPLTVIKSIDRPGQCP
jgi:hypothetical protein